VQLNPRDPIATSIVARMDELFAVEAEARSRALSLAARHIRRQKTAAPLLDNIRSKIDAAQSAALPSRALSKACQYALTLWKKLTRFLEHPELELSTNLAENSMRPVLWAGKTGSTSAVHKQDRRLQRFSGRGKLPSAASPGARLLFHDSPGLADLPIRCLRDLTPAVWVARHSQTQARGY
jgi:transposase